VQHYGDSGIREPFPSKMGSFRTFPDHRRAAFKAKKTNDQSCSNSQFFSLKWVRLARKPLSSLEQVA
jgi:hypothetical protein